MANCIICLQKSSNLTKISAKDKRVTWIHKLRSCVPEVKWNHDELICQNCTKQLDSAYAFRNMCIKSYAVHKKQVNTNSTLKNYNEKRLRKSKSIPTKEKGSAENGISYGQDPDKSSENHLCHVSKKGNMNLKSGRLQYECKFCLRKFMFFLGLQVHTRQAHQHNLNIKCCFCDKKFNSKPLFQMHLKEHSNKIKIIECKFCSKTFALESEYKRHVSQVHKKKYLPIRFKGACSTPNTTFNGENSGLGVFSDVNNSTMINSTTKESKLDVSSKDCSNMLEGASSSSFATTSIDIKEENADEFSIDANVTRDLCTKNKIDSINPITDTDLVKQEDILEDIAMSSKEAIRISTDSICNNEMSVDDSTTNISAFQPSNGDFNRENFTDSIAVEKQPAVRNKQSSEDQFVSECNTFNEENVAAYTSVSESGDKNPVQISKDVLNSENIAVPAFVAVPLCDDINLLPENASKPCIAEDLVNPLSIEVDPLADKNIPFNRPSPQKDSLSSADGEFTVRKFITIKPLEELLIEKSVKPKKPKKIATKPPPAVKIKKVEKFKTANPKINKRAYHCKFCIEKFRRNVELTQHIRKVHLSKATFDCDKCSQSFRSRANLFQHKKHHSGAKSFICKCGKVYATKGELLQHEKTHVKVKEYKCEQCGKCFNTKKILGAHTAIVHDRANWKFVCPFCEKLFPLKENLDNHVSSHLGLKMYSCHLCDQKFTMNAALEAHLLMHIKVYKCEKCEREYKSKKTLDLHVAKSHSEAVPRIETTLHSVEETHPEEKAPLTGADNTGSVESKCSEEAPLEENLHLEEQKVDPLFKCDFCCKIFISAETLGKHVIVHHIEFDVCSCPQCDKIFTSDIYLKKHLLTFHK